MTDKLPDVMTDEEWQAFIGQFNTKCPTGLRNAALFTVMHDAGLRTCEIIGLKTSDLHRDRLDGEEVLRLHLKVTKRGREREVYLPARARQLLEAWLEQKKALGLGRYKTVFTTLKGEPLQSAYLREVAARKGNEAGITWRVHPHALRHTFATELLEEHGDLALVQDALGHSRPEDTRIYAKVHNKRLGRAMVHRKGQAPQEPTDPLAAKKAALVTAGFTEAQAAALLAALPEK